MDKVTLRNTDSHSRRAVYVDGERAGHIYRNPETLDFWATPDFARYLQGLTDQSAEAWQDVDLKPSSWCELVTGWLEIRACERSGYQTFPAY